MDLLDIAEEFVNEKFAGCRGILGVLLTGSAVIGVRDELVDLDFEVVVAMSITKLVSVWLMRLNMLVLTFAGAGHLLRC